MQKRYMTIESIAYERKLMCEKWQVSIVYGRRVRFKFVKVKLSKKPLLLC